MEPATITAKRILVVDDEPLVGNSVSMVLGFGGYKVQVTNGGKEALAMLEQSEFDLVITDFNMPGMNGDELALHLKARWPDMPIIMLTAYAENLRASETGLPGVDALISKPFEVAELRLVVAQAFSGRNFQSPPEQS